MDKLDKIKELLDRANAQANPQMEMLNKLKGIEELFSRLGGLKGEKGDTPIKGVDYFTQEEIDDFLKQATPILGKDYLTQEELRYILEVVTPKKGKDYFDGKDGKSIKGDRGEKGERGNDGYTPIKGIDYFDGEKGEDGKTPDPKEVIAEIKKLKGDDRLDISNIRNGEALARALNKKGKLDMSDMRWHGAGVTKIIAGSNISISPTDGLGEVTITGTGGGSGITRSINSISSDTTAGSTASTDYVYFVSGTTTITLPTAVSNTNRYTIKNTGSNTVTIATTGGQTIDGSANATLSVGNTSLDLISNNSNWFVV
jgi:hypothetical protein